MSKTLENEEYTVEDFINKKNPEGCRVRVYYIEGQKELITEGIGLGYIKDSNGKKHDAVIVYSSETGKEYSASLSTKDATQKNFFKKKREILCVHDFGGASRVVDTEANINGRYTVIATGKYYGKKYFMRNEHEEEREVYKVRDNETGREYWELDSSDLIIEKSEYTNVVLLREKVLILGDIEEIDFTYIYKKYLEIHNKYEIVINKAEKMIDEALEAGGLMAKVEYVKLSNMSDNELTEKLKQLDDEVVQLNKQVRELSIRNSFMRINKTTLYQIIDYHVSDINTLYDTKREVCNIIGVKKVYFGQLRGHDDDTIVYSCDKSKVKEYLRLTIQCMLNTNIEQAKLSLTVKGKEL
jgi:hypothetical protein